MQAARAGCAEEIARGRFAAWGGGKGSQGKGSKRKAKDLLSVRCKERVKHIFNCKNITNIVFTII